MYGGTPLSWRGMAEPLPRLIIHYPDGVLADGVCWVSLGSRNSSRTDAFYQEQFDGQGFVPTEGAKVLMRDADGDMSDEVGIMHWSESTGWSLVVDPWTQN